MKLGLVTDSLVDRSLAEAAAVCRGLGLEQVELGCGNWSPAPHVDLKRLTGRTPVPGTGCWILWGKTASRSPP